jgi:hypothetical protein
MTEKCKLNRSRCLNISCYSAAQTGLACVAALDMTQTCRHMPSHAVTCRHKAQCYQSQSQSHVTTDGQSVSMSWCRGPSGSRDQMFITVWRLLLCLCWTPSLTRGRFCRLSARVCIFKSFVSTYISIYISDVKHTNSCTYSISKASVGPGSVQQFMPY